MKDRWYSGKKKLHLGLQQQLLLGAVLLVLLPILMVSVWINYKVSTNLRAEAGQEEKKITSDVTYLLDKFLTTSEDSLQAATLLPGWQDSGIRQKNLKALEESPVGWSRVEYQDRVTGEVWSAGSNLPSHSALPLPAQTDQTTQDRVTSVQISTLADPQKQGIEWFVFSVPLPSTAQTGGGVLKAYFPLQTLKNELRGGLSLPSTTRVWLADDQGRFVLDSKNAAQGSKSLTPAFLAELGQANLVSESNLPQWGWQVVVAQDRSATLADVSQMTWEIAGIASVVLVLTLILISIYSRHLLRSVGQLMQHIRALSNGAVLADLPPLQVQGNELGEAVLAVEKLAAQIQEVLHDTVMALVAALEVRDPYTRNHSERVALFARLLARQAGYEEAFLEKICLAGRLHDVGKIGVPESVLNKNGPLEDSEWKVMKTHPVKSYEIVKEVPWYAETGIAVMILQHHERWDGRGYPQGLSGDEILQGARILTVADAFDAMTSNRVYRKAMSLEKALAEVKQGSGVQFDPTLVEHFLHIPVEYLQACLGISLKEFLAVSLV